MFYIIYWYKKLHVYTCRCAILVCFYQGIQSLLNCILAINNFSQSLDIKLFKRPIDFSSLLYKKNLKKFCSFKLAKYSSGSTALTQHKWRTDETKERNCFRNHEWSRRRIFHHRKLRKRFSDFKLFLILLFRAFHKRIYTKRLRQVLYTYKCRFLLFGLHAVEYTCMRYKILQ